MDLEVTVPAGAVCLLAGLWSCAQLVLDWKQAQSIWCVFVSSINYQHYCRSVDGVALVPRQQAFNNSIPHTGTATPFHCGHHQQSLLRRHNCTTLHTIFCVDDCSSSWSPRRVALTLVTVGSVCRSAAFIMESCIDDPLRGYGCTASVYLCSFVYLHLDQD
jgi:hypothetical protein